MELHDLVRCEWRDDHRLSRRSIMWIEEHADPGDTHPIITAIAQLRAEQAHTPSRGRYVRGCRCPGCRHANARYSVGYRRRATVIDTPPAASLPALCWCQHETKPVPAADVAAGQTWTCHRAGCGPP